MQIISITAHGKNKINKLTLFKAASVFIQSTHPQQWGWASCSWLESSCSPPCTWTHIVLWSQLTLWSPVHSLVHHTHILDHQRSLTLHHRNSEVSSLSKPERWFCWPVLTILPGLASETSDNDALQKSMWRLMPLKRRTALQVIVSFAQTIADAFKASKCNQWYHLRSKLYKGLPASSLYHNTR